MRSEKITKITNRMVRVEEEKIKKHLFDVYNQFISEISALSLAVGGV